MRKLIFSIAVLLFVSCVSVVHKQAADLVYDITHNNIIRDTLNVTESMVDEYRNSDTLKIPIIFVPTSYKEVVCTQAGEQSIINATNTLLNENLNSMILYSIENGYAVLMPKESITQEQIKYYKYYCGKYDVRTAILSATRALQQAEKNNEIKHQAEQNMKEIQNW